MNKINEKEKLIKMDSVETTIKNLCAEIDSQMQNSIIFNLPDPPRIPPTPGTNRRADSILLKDEAGGKTNSSVFDDKQTKTITSMKHPENKADIQTLIQTVSSENNSANQLKNGSLSISNSAPSNIPLPISNDTIPTISQTTISTKTPPHKLNPVSAKSFTNPIMSSFSCGNVLTNTSQDNSSSGFSEISHIFNEQAKRRKNVGGYKFKNYRYGKYGKNHTFSKSHCSNFNDGNLINYQSSPLRGTDTVVEIHDLSSSTRNSTFSSINSLGDRFSTSSSIKYLPVSIKNDNKTPKNTANLEKIQTSCLPILESIRPPKSVNYLLLGPSGCGKSTLATTYTCGDYLSTHIPTILETFEVFVNSKEKTIPMKIWDTSGNLTMLSIIGDKIPKPDCILLCFDGSKFEEQVIELKKLWMPKIDELFGDRNQKQKPPKNIYLVATKSDNLGGDKVKSVKTVVSRVLGKQFMEKLYFVSSATEKNVKTLFDESLMESLENIEKLDRNRSRDRSWTMKILQGLCSN